MPYDEFYHHDDRVRNIFPGVTFRSAFLRASAELIPSSVNNTMSSL